MPARKKRSAGHASLEKLRFLVKETGNACWIREDYRFLFPGHARRTIYDMEKPPIYDNCSFGSYFWRGREIYVTYAEALYLYERLVLGKRGRHLSTNGILRNLRKRLGDTFLAEYLLPMEQMKREKLRSETGG